MRRARSGVNPECEISLCLSGNGTSILETKGAFDAAGDHAVKPAQDKCKAKAIRKWENKYKEKSIAESSGAIDNIVFGIAREINGQWRVYRGDGEDYDDTTSDNWKLLDDIIS